MSYNRKKMDEALNLALQSIFSRHQPPVGHAIEALTLALIATIKSFVKDEDANELVDSLIEEIQEQCKITVH